MQNLAVAGYEGASPVGSFPPTGYGLDEMAVNVWEWTSDYFTSRHPDAVSTACCISHHPRVDVPVLSETADPLGNQIPCKVIKRGSHLCVPNSCMRYRPAARQGETVDTSISHIGIYCFVLPA